MHSRSAIILAGILLGGSLLLTAPVQAQSTYDPRIQQREQYEQQRIQQGIQNGSITPDEARRLEAEQSRIQQKEQRMKSDGNLSQRERARLNEQLNKANRDIYRESHNSQVAGAVPGNKENRHERWRRHHRDRDRAENNHVRDRY